MYCCPNLEFWGYTAPWPGFELPTLVISSGEPEMLTRLIHRPIKASVTGCPALCLALRQDRRLGLRTSSRVMSAQCRPAAAHVVADHVRESYAELAATCHASSLTRAALRTPAR